jgi:hypothetical protein
MANPLASYGEYAALIFALLSDRPAVKGHTLTVFTTSRTVGTVRGEVEFHSGHVLRVFEQIDFLNRRIVKYFYGLSLRNEALWWYDSMPHPNNPTLASTDPHHKHIPPDIKHNRIPAPEVSFTVANLPFLIEDAERLIESRR